MDHVNGQGPVGSRPFLLCFDIGEGNGVRRRDVAVGSCICALFRTAVIKQQHDNTSPEKDCRHFFKNWVSWSSKKNIRARALPHL